MKLRYVNIWLSPRTGYDDDYRYEFTLHTRFIGNYLSRQMRTKEHWFETDGTFNMISAHPMPDKLEGCKIVPESALRVDVPFDKERYEQIRGSTDCEYYLELLEEGFRKASKFKEIPLQTLLILIDEFRKNGYKNEWLHKNKRFKEQDIEVVLNCYFTTLDFKLVATINRISTKEELCSGTVLLTEPDEICFDWMFNDILIDTERIIITDKLSRPRIIINLMDALRNELTFELLEDEAI